MNPHIFKINNTIEPYRLQIINHKLYSRILTIEDLRVFMEFHVYAVFDFMSLLKALQNSLTCTNIPWVPKGSGGNRFFINEIVVGEESDIDIMGNRKSHFEIYLDAMIQSNSRTSTIDNFVTQLKKGYDINTSMCKSKIAQSAQDFMRFTFEVINTKKEHLMASVFTFGREDLIPSMFHSIVSDIDKINPNQITIFKYYLERHIEVDSSEHSVLAIQMLESLCGNDPKLWQEAEEIAVLALKKRIQLWDGIYAELVTER